MSSHAERCPVCNGTGLVPNGFYSQTSGFWYSNSTKPETCKSCSGRGYIVINDDANYIKEQTDEKTS